MLKIGHPGRTDAEAEAPILWPLDAKNWKRPLAGMLQTRFTYMTGSETLADAGLVGAAVLQCALIIPGFPGSIFPVLREQQ